MIILKMYTIQIYKMNLYSLLSLDILPVFMCFVNIIGKLKNWNKTEPLVSYWRLCLTVFSVFSKEGSSFKLKVSPQRSILQKTKYKRTMEFPCYCC